MARTSTVPSPRSCGPCPTPGSRAARTRRWRAPTRGILRPSGQGGRRRLSGRSAHRKRSARGTTALKWASDMRRGRGSPQRRLRPHCPSAMSRDERRDRAWRRDRVWGSSRIAAAPHLVRDAPPRPDRRPPRSPSWKGPPGAPPGRELRRHRRDGHLHVNDVSVRVGAESFERRLYDAGFAGVMVDAAEGRLRFIATKSKGNGPR